MGLPSYIICFFLSYSLQYSFSVLCACCFNDDMLWGGSACCPGSLLYLNGKNFLEIYYCYYFIDYITYPFGLHLLSFFTAHDPLVLSFDGVAELLHIPLAALDLFY
jgi:hypothetical protein